MVELTVDTWMAVVEKVLTSLTKENAALRLYEGSVREALKTDRLRVAAAVDQVAQEVDGGPT